MVEVVLEPSETPLPNWPLENCALCFKPTRYWYEPKDIALCQSCAKTAEAEALPSKVEWCTQVRERMKARA